MAKTSKTIETEVKIGKALSQIKELEKAFARVSTKGVSPINKSLVQMNQLLKSSRALAGGLSKDFDKVVKATKDIKSSTQTIDKSLFSRLTWRRQDKDDRSDPNKKSEDKGPSFFQLLSMARKMEAVRPRGSSIPDLLSDPEAYKARREGFLSALGDKKGLGNFKKNLAAKYIPRLAGLATAATAASVAVAAVAAAAATASAAVVGLGAAFVGLGSKMMQSEEQLAKLQTAFQSQAMAAEEYSKAVLHAARTPFETDEVIGAVVQMQVFQVNAFERIGKSGRKLVDILGDMAGATGTDLATATHALQRAMVGEWEIMQNNFQISAKMIPQLKGVATGTDEYKRAIIEYLEQQERFVGGQEIMARSIKGMWSNIKDAFSNIVTFTAGVADSKAELSNVTLYDKFRESIEGIYSALSRPGILDEYAQDIENIVKGNDKAAASVTKLNSLFGGNADLASLQAALDPKLIDSVKLAKLYDMGYALDGLYSRGEKIVALGQIIGQFMKVLYAGTFKPVVEGIGKGIDWALGKFEEFISYVTTSNVFGLSTFENEEDAIRSLTKIAIDAGKNFGFTADQLATGIEGIVDKMGVKGAQFDEEVRRRGINTLNGWQKLVMVFSILMEFVSMYIEDKMSGVFKLFKSLGAGLLDGFSVVTDGTFEALFNQFKDMIVGVGMTNEEVSESMSKAWEGFGAVVGAVFGIFVNTMTTTISVLVAVGRTLWNVLQIAGRLVTLLSEVLTGRFAEAGETLKNIGGDFADIFDAAKGVGDVFSNSFAGVIDSAKKIGSVFLPVQPSYSTYGDSEKDPYKKADEREKSRKKDAKDQKKILNEQLRESINNRRSLGYEIYRTRKAIEDIEIAYVYERRFDNDYKPPFNYLWGNDGNIQPPVKKFAVGSFNLPKDELIFAHKGEMIIPAREADYLRNMMTPNNGFRQGARLAGSMLPAVLETQGVTNKTINSPTINQYFMGQSGSRVATQLYNEAKNLAREVVVS